MPVLDWIGKQAVVNHHLEVPYRLLEGHHDLSVGEEGTGNLLVEGDNLEALKALLPHYAGQVKCIYIDPPYNTGNENWIYSDSVNAPEIKKWLQKVVGGEAEDLSRHDKWLCMMYPRLRLLRQFLREDGAIFVSIDDNEVSHLRCVMDEIFGASNFIGVIIWQKMDSPKNTAIHLSVDHDYIAVYAKDASVWRPHKLPRTEKMLARYKNPDNDPRGPWLLSDLAARNFYADGRYPITTLSGRVIEGPPAGSYWRVSRGKFDELNRDGRIWWGKSGGNRPGIKRFLSEVQEGVVPQTLWPWKDAGSTRHAKQELSQVMGARASQDLFITPKPTRLVRRILQLATDEDSLILDSFAGSGTTAHATLAQNAEDGGSRRFIIVELEPDIARPVARERLRRAAEGYAYAKSSGTEETVEGLGGGFRYCTLGATLFDEMGRINPEVIFEDLARHVWFAETREPLLGQIRGDTPLLGTHRGTAYYLLYNGVLKDRRPGGGNVLTRAVLESLPAHDGRRVVYGVGCRLGADRLRAAGVVFRHIPYEVEGGR